MSAKELHIERNCLSFGNLYSFRTKRWHEIPESMSLSFVLLCGISGSEKTILVLRFTYHYARNSGQPFPVQLLSSEIIFEAEILSRTQASFCLFFSFYKTTHSRRPKNSYHISREERKGRVMFRTTVGWKNVLSVGKFDRNKEKVKGNGASWEGRQNTTQSVQESMTWTLLCLEKSEALPRAHCPKPNSLTSFHSW